MHVVTIGPSNTFISDIFLSCQLIEGHEPAEQWLPMWCKLQITIQVQWNPSPFLDPFQVACCQQLSAVILKLSEHQPLLKDLLESTCCLAISPEFLSGSGVGSENMHFWLLVLGDTDAVGVRVKEIRSNKNIGLQMEASYTWLSKKDHKA